MDELFKTGSKTMEEFLTQMNNQFQQAFEAGTQRERTFQKATTKKKTTTLFNEKIEELIEKRKKTAWEDYQLNYSKKEALKTCSPQDYQKRFEAEFESHFTKEHLLWIEDDLLNDDKSLGLIRKMILERFEEMI